MIRPPCANIDCHYMQEWGCCPNLWEEEEAECYIKKDEE